ncbi:TPA: restriction endonuclease subunit S [Vibrio diabolicus]
MSDWYETRLGDIADICIGGTPSRAEASYWASTGEEGFPWVSISDLKSRIVSNTAESITALGARNSNVKLVPCGTIMMSFKLSLGRIAFAGRDIYTNEAIASFEVDTDKIDKTFLFYQLPEVVKLAITDTAIKGATLNKAKLNELVIPHPKLVVQRKIAEILSTIDNQIDATQALIDKYTAIKQGMMADLFSRGIDPETKALRPTFEEAPELYHKTPLGMLPKGWDVKTLGNAINGSGFIQTGPFGSQLHAYDYVDSGVPVVMPQDIVQGRISIEKIAYITERKAIELSRHKLKINDVIFSRRGDLTRSSFVDVQNGYEGFLCGTGCLLMRVDASNIVGGWFSYLYSSDLVQRQVEGLAVGTTMPNLNGSILKKLIIPFPSVEEQTHIFSKIASAQRLIDENAKHLGKLVAQKSGLMQDLLTGKVSVPA